LTLYLLNSLQVVLHQVMKRYEGQVVQVSEGQVALLCEAWQHQQNEIVGSGF